MKKIPKKLFDEFVALSREYWQFGGADLLGKRIDVAKEIDSATEVDWLNIVDFVDSIIRREGFLPNAENEMLYILLRVLGWEVVDEEQPSESL